MDTAQEKISPLEKLVHNFAWAFIISEGASVLLMAAAAIAGRI